ncbi:hypothetical protein EGA70_14655 [Salmonella enterica]|nr:hypothetical protein [Salmonella enterica]
MGRVSFHKAIFTGLVKLAVILSVSIMFCSGIGMIYNHFDFYPSFLTLIADEVYSKNTYTGTFLMGLVSLPFLLVFFVLMVVLFAIVIYVILELGGYYE